MTTGRINQVARDEGERRLDKPVASGEANRSDEPTQAHARHSTPGRRDATASECDNATPTERTRRRCSPIAPRHTQNELRRATQRPYHQRDPRQAELTRRRSLSTRRAPNQEVQTRRATHQATTQGEITNAQPRKQ